MCVPVHDMENGGYFLKRLTDSLAKQTFQDFELIVTEQGTMPENSNRAIKRAKGDIIKMLYMDDFLYSRLALQNLSDTFKGGWIASGCIHTQDGENFFNPHRAVYGPRMRQGENTIGSPSVVAFANDNPLLFDENLSWLLDCELYSRLDQRYGNPTIIETFDIAIGVGMHQQTHIMTDEQKQKEHEYLHETN